MLGVAALNVLLGGLLLLALLLNRDARRRFFALPNRRLLSGVMLAWFAWMSLSVIATNTDYGEGILVIGITFAAFAMGWLVFVALHDADWMLVIRSLGIGALIVILFALVEILAIEPLNAWIDTFTSNSSFVDIARISSLFAHPNYMAAYLELTLPFVVVWMLHTRHSMLRLGLALVLVVGLNVFVLSISRGAIFSFYGALVLHGILAYFMRQRQLTQVSLALLGLLTLTIIGQIVVMPRVVVRYVSEGSNDLWYGATVQTRETATVAPGEMLSFSVNITNNSIFEWTVEGDQPVNLGYHIICHDNHLPPSSDRVDMASFSYLVARGPRTPLPYDIARDETITLDTVLTAPDEPGEYLIAWDMVQESITWFSEKGVVPFFTALTVGDGVAASVAPCGTPFYAQDSPPDQPSRLTIWRTALGAIRDHPLFGLGARDFNSYYERMNGMTLSIPHAHNSYLNTLVDFGVLSSVFIGFALLSIVQLLVNARPTPDDKRAWSIWFAISIALTSFGLHSVVESFNYQPSILVVVCVIIGILARLADPDRVPSATRN